MPRYEFRQSPIDTIIWSFDRRPEIGEEIVLGERGVFRVIRVDKPLDATVEAEFAVARLRDATWEEKHEQRQRGVNVLPPRR
jgi:hypothetical protein